MNLTDEPIRRSEVTTVVIPAYNAAQWIEETLGSVAAQTIGEDRLEVVVVDDGSSDDSDLISERFLSTAGFNRWEVIRQPNRGPGAARNLGWRWGKGKWVQFLDADDLIAPEKLELQLQDVMKGDGSLATMFSDWTKFGVMDARFEELDRVISPRLGAEVVRDLLWGDNSVATGSEIYARAWLERVGGWDEKFPNGEDHDLRVRIAFAGGQYIHAPSDRPLFYYRRHPPSVKSLTSKSGRANAEVWIRLAGLVEEEWRRREELTTARAELLAEKFASAGRSMAMFDLTAAYTAFDRADALVPGFRPALGGRFGQVASVVGHRRAAWLASRSNRLLTFLRLQPRLTTVPRPYF